MVENSENDKALPDKTVDQVVSLTLNARESDDTENDYIQKRDDILERHGYTARIREEDDTLVLYPLDWIDDGGEVDFSQIQDTNRAIEESLSGVNEGADWENIEETNSEIVSEVREEYGDTHAENIRAFADYMGNHFLKVVTEATKEEKEQFKEEYYIRNVWSNESQESALEESLDLIDEDMEEYGPE